MVDDMARYVDADKFAERIKVSPAFRNIYDGLLLQRVVIDLLNNIPTADVAPKSECERCGEKTRKTIESLQKIIAKERTEVEELIYKLECLLCHATGSRLSKHTYDLRTMETAVTDYINYSYEDGYKDGASEVAREIFEEIEDLLKIVKLPYFDAEGYVTPMRAGYWAIDPNDYAELKKKYTGEDGK